MPRRYKKLKKCREELKDYLDDLDVGTRETDQRDSDSLKRYAQDIRWFDGWLDDQGIESAFDLSPSHANRLGRHLAKQFNGTTPRYRWDRIKSMYDWFAAMEMIGKNPMGKWDEKKVDRWGMTKTTQQSRELNSDETYAVDAEDVRMMEENVGRNRVRDQLIIRLMWQTGMRRGEASDITLDMVDRDSREIRLPGDITKNGKPRVVAYQQSLDGLLKEWLDYGYREEMLAGNDHDYILVGERGAPLSGDRINNIVIESADRAGINRKMYGDANSPIDPETGEPKKNRWKITAHNIRHGYGSYLVNKTDAGLWEVSKQMGHSSVSVTENTYVEDDPRAGIEHAHKYGPE